LAAVLRRVKLFGSLIPATATAGIAVMRLRWTLDVGGDDNVADP